jgi:hypothetical protein
MMLPREGAPSSPTASRADLLAMFCGGHFENSAANSVRVTELLALSVPLSLPLWAAIYSFGNLD